MAKKIGIVMLARIASQSHFQCGDTENRDAEFFLRLADYLGQIRQNQQQCGGEKDESGLTYFRLFEHGLTAFFCYSLISASIAPHGSALHIL
jgi:hypothetical protein